MLKRFIANSATKIKSFSKWLDKSQKPAYMAIAVTVLAFLFFYPVISAGVNYADDSNRDFQTYISDHGYTPNGRFIADFISRLQTGAFGTAPVDLGNFGQILGLVVLILSILLLMRLKLGFSVKSFIFTIPLILNPFLLENISYKYDSFGMLLAYALAIAAFAIFKQSTARILLVGLLLFISFGIYQSMPVITIALALIWFIIGKLDSKKINFSIVNLLSIGLVYCGALLLQQLFVKLFLPPMGGWNKITISPSSSIDNMNNLLDTLVKPFLKSGFIGEITIVLLLLSVVAYVILWLKSDKKVSSTILSIIAILLLPLCFLGPLLILHDPNIHHPRVVSSIILIYLPCTAIIYVARSLPLYRTVLVVLTCLLTLILVHFSFIYGNLLKTTSQYRNLQVATMQTAVQLNGLTDGKFYLESSGTHQYSIVTKKTIKQYPILRAIADEMNGVAWYERILANYNIDTVVDWIKAYPDKKELICTSGTAPVLSTKSFVIYEIPNEPEKSYLLFIKDTGKPEKAYCDYSQQEL